MIPIEMLGLLAYLSLAFAIVARARPMPMESLAGYGDEVISDANQLLHAEEAAGLPAATPQPRDQTSSPMPPASFNPLSLLAGFDDSTSSYHGEASSGGHSGYPADAEGWHHGGYAADLAGYDSGNLGGSTGFSHEHVSFHGVSGYPADGEEWHPNHYPFEQGQDGVPVLAHDLDPYGHPATANRRFNLPGLGRQHQPEPHHGSGSRGSIPLEGLDPYVGDRLTRGQKLTSSGSGSVDRSPALAPPRQVSTPFNSNDGGTSELAQHGSRPDVPAKSTQPRQLERGATSRRKQRVERGGSKQSYGKSQLKGLENLDQFEEPDSHAIFAKVAGTGGFLLGTAAQKQKVEELFYKQAEPGSSMTWLDKRPVRWSSDVDKKHSLLTAMETPRSSSGALSLKPYFFNDHLIYFTAVRGHRGLMDAFAIPSDRSSNELEDGRYKLTHVGTFKYAKGPSEPKTTGV